MSPWDSDPGGHEKGFHRMALELRRLRRRALARPGLVVLIAALATTGAVVRQALHKERFQASVSFRVVERLEGAPGEDIQPQTKRRLREYVIEGIFTRPRLRMLVEKYDLYPDWTAVSVDRGVEALRDDIAIKVSQNYFLRESWGDTTPRSARMRITYLYTDVDVAASVVEDLGDLVQRHEVAARRELAEQAARETALTERRANDRLDKLREKLARAEIALDTAHPRQRAVLMVEISQVRQALRAVKAKMDRLRSESGRTELRAGFESNELLLSFHKTDESRSPPSSLSRTSRLVLVGVVVFLFFLPISGIAVAAFDPLVYSMEDLGRLGLKPLAHLTGLGPRGYGSLEQRTERSNEQRGPDPDS